MTEPEVVRDLFEQLVLAPLHPISEPWPEAHGVYVIVGPEGEPVYVGRSVRHQHGLFARWNRHNKGRSSFMRILYNRDRSKLDGHQARWLLVEDNRLRCLLEYLAIGILCPKHVGLGTAPISNA